MFRLFFKFYFMLFLGVLLYLLFGLISQHTWLNEKIEEDRANDLTATIYLLDTVYRRLGENAFRRTIEGYPSASNIPVVLFDIDSLRLSSEMESTVRSGRLVTNRELVSYDAPRDIGLYYNLPDSNLVLGVGPLGRGQDLDVIVTIYERSILLIVALPMILIILNLASRLRRMETAATEFGSGNFSIRVSEEKSHRVGNLNRDFNRMAERVEHLVQGHKELSNAVAHELRTPISRIRFEVDMMQMEQDENAKNEYMYGISENIDELSDFVDELLTYARFDREVTGLALTPHSLQACLDSVVRARIFDSEKVLTCDDSWATQIGSRDQIGFDPKHLERAIGNLITNADKYSESKVHVHVKQENNFAYVYVDDDGPGIPPAERVDIFMPFKRLDSSRTLATGGFGLGLSIVKRIAQWHGGDVSVETSPLGGARFIFYWPI